MAYSWTAPAIMKFWLIHFQEQQCRCTKPPSDPLDPSTHEVTCPFRVAVERMDKQADPTIDMAAQPAKASTDPLP